MADWALTHLPDVTEQFMVRSAQPDTEAKIKPKPAMAFHCYRGCHGWQP